MELRRHIGYVIQQIGLFPNMTVAQNICVVPKLLKYSKEQCDQHRPRSMLAMVEMPYEQYANKYPSRDVRRTTAAHRHPPGTGRLPSYRPDG